MASNNLSFIDLFSGIGGFHLAMQSYGVKCAFASEWDKHAAQVYFNNFGIQPAGDITKIDERDIPQHDILCAGFPCQAFSVSGNQKGFEDTRGTLFFDIARIAIYHQPKVLFLENVKNLTKHDKGRTFNVILKTLRDIGYTVFFAVLNASRYGLPQNRKRLYIVGFHNSLGIKEFDFPKPLDTPTSVAQILEANPDILSIDRDDIQLYHNKLTLPRLFDEGIVFHNRPIQIGIVNKGGQGERIYDINGHGITLSAYGGGVGAKTGLFLTKEGIRRLTPRECARLQGFPDNFVIDRNPNQAYKQFGNSVPVNVLREIVQNIFKKLYDHESVSRIRI